MSKLIGKLEKLFLSIEVKGYKLAKEEAIALGADAIAALPLDVARDDPILASAIVK